MKISYIAIGAIASVLTINSVMAAGENTVASKSYVDARDDLKQDLIPESGVNIDANGIGDTVITYTDTEGVIGERNIYDGENDYDEDDDADSLVTAGVIADFASAVENITIENTVLSPVNHSLQSCSSGDTDCDLWTISTGTQNIVESGTFAPLTRSGSAAPSCKAYGESVSDASECCSGVLTLMTGNNKCGCNTVDDCPSGSTRCDGTRMCSNK